MEKLGAFGAGKFTRLIGKYIIKWKYISIKTKRSKYETRIFQQVQKIWMEQFDLAEFSLFQIGNRGIRYVLQEIG